MSFKETHHGENVDFEWSDKDIEDLQEKSYNDSRRIAIRKYYRNRGNKNYRREYVGSRENIPEHYKKRKPIEFGPWAMFFVVVVFAIFFYVLLTSFSEPTTNQNITENQSDIIPTKTINPTDLTEQQLTKARSLTKEAQIKEFGGILVEYRTELKPEENKKIQENVLNEEQVNLTDWIDSILDDISKLGNSVASEVTSFFEIPTINETWVHNFMVIVNEERAKKGLSIMKESKQLNAIADSRFTKMMESPFISHYGAESYNVGEVIFYPESSSEQNYIKKLQVDAPLHWDLLMDPMFSVYGYHIEEGPTMAVYDPCSTTEIPGPNIDVKKFFEQHGCNTVVQNSMWLVIDMT